MNRQLLRVAHRGGSQLAPENTLAAFRNALTLPIDAVECDVQMSRDGQIIVFHDATVERVTDGNGNILDLDFAYLRSLNAAARFPGSWPQPQQIPTLREVLDLTKGRVQVCIEVKMSEREKGVYGRYPGIAEAVVDHLRTADMLSQALVISFDWLILQSLQALEPAIQTGAIVSLEQWAALPAPRLEALIVQVATPACQWIDMDYRLFSPELLDGIHRRGLKLGLWTVNTLEDLRRLADAGVDALVTDRPDLFSLL
ncbi:MAG: hypothetical protein IMW89_18045 [Ktedonobacteraceae bacterium]|nr:hypothetical protein [Ktedonobacteraceae bacterium]